MKYLYLAFACVLSSCAGSVDKLSTTEDKTLTEAIETPVEDLSSATSSRTVSKGMIESMTDVSVYSELSEQVMQMLFKEGDKVQKGQTLLVLNDEKLRTQLVQSENQMKQAEFQYEEILIGQGYKRTEFDRVPENIKDLARLKSGYNTQKESLEQARRQYEKRIVKAPVSGTVTQVEVHQYDMLNGSTAVCHILDTEHLKVSFSILETELSRLAIGNQVKVTAIAYPEESHTATITSISPTVNANGMVGLKATIDDCEHLMPGMTALVEKL